MVVKDEDRYQMIRLAGDDEGRIVEEAEIASKPVEGAHENRVSRSGLSGVVA
jgi:hypothetical protein